jgi:putative flippase GtrA
MSAVATMGDTPKPPATMGDTPKPPATMGDTPKPPATTPAVSATETPPVSVGTKRRKLAGYLGRHQVASLVSTVVDFGTMVLLVELLHRSAVVGTMAGATCGALTNFELGRHWTFRADKAHVAPQALRYALVSAASAALNALGEYGLHDRLGMQYFAARAVVAVAVSLLWNFPLQRHFVFRQEGHDTPGKDRA